jgi:catechol 2,3-dioxygenase-like lactoylglutathione lyase family enzyme
VIVTSTPEQRTAWLNEVAETVDRWFPVSHPVDEEGMRTRIRGVDHIQLAMPAGEEARARAFYAGLLGLQEIAKPAELAGRGGAWFSNGAVTLHLGVEPEFRPARKAHPALLVEGLAAFIARLGAAGCAIQRDVQFAGYERVHVYDPFGNRIELMERTA